jgi:hypothetical protein
MAWRDDAIQRCDKQVGTSIVARRAWRHDTTRLTSHSVVPGPKCKCGTAMPRCLIVPCPAGLGNASVVPYLGPVWPSIIIK